MKPTQALHDLGRSIWLDNITRDLLDDGTLSSPRRRSSTAFAGELMAGIAAKTAQVAKAG